VRLREVLRWFDMQARFGKTVVVMHTRSQTSAAFLLLGTLSAEVDRLPCRPMTGWYALMKTVTVVSLIVNKRPGIIA
jgi:hypothetical protein